MVPEVPPTRYGLHPAWTHPAESPASLDDIECAAHTLVDRTNQWLGQAVQARADVHTMGDALGKAVSALQRMADHAAALARTTPDTRGVVDYLVQNGRAFAHTYQSYGAMQQQIGMNAMFSTQVTALNNWQFDRTIWQLERRQMDSTLG